ncbi:two-component response regulator ARR14-like [Solanum lycopersicum]|uniref:two-component response regulator ARR14-like n=1 Tax=Solanum lycopersicum TaxID=4081 RepID=UPI0037494053
MEVENECYDNEFLEKISILVVDDDTSSLLITSELLKKENFKVVTVKNANEALSTLQINENSFDLVIIEVRVPVMNGLQLQQQITNGFNIPVVLISDDKSECGIIQGFESGAVFLMVKPISQNDVHELWQYAIMQRKKKKNRGKQGIVQENTNEEIVAENLITPPKKTRLVWTEYLHNKFLEAITILGLKRAHPKRILELMNIPELTRENVASHLQKYRLYLKKVTAPIDTSRKPISKSRIGNARKAIQLAATSTQQLMTENSNSVTAHNDELVAPFQRDPKDKIFTDMLSYHLSREYRDRINNFYSIMNSNMQITNASNNVQSSIMENNNIEEGTNLSFVDGNNQYQQAYFPWVDHTLDQTQVTRIDTQRTGDQVEHSRVNWKNITEILINAKEKSPHPDI